MIYHNAKNGFFPSNIVNEKYTPIVIRISSAPDGAVNQSRTIHDVFVTHDMFGSALTLELENESYTIVMDKIIADILEVEHENETLYADR